MVFTGPIESKNFIFRIFVCMSAVYLLNNLKPSACFFKMKSEEFAINILWHREFCNCVLGIVMDIPRIYLSGLNAW